MVPAMNVQRMDKPTISIADYAAVVQFAEMSGAHITELQVESLVVVEKSLHKALTAFREMASGFDAVLNITRNESQVPVKAGDAVIMNTYTCVRGTGVRVSH